MHSHPTTEELEYYTKFELVGLVWETGCYHPHSFGSDESGQLGHNQGAPSLRAPRLVKSLGTVRVVAVAAGLYHSAALTASGHLYTWGSNSKGQLGLGRQAGDLVFRSSGMTRLECYCVPCSPARVESLVGIPLAGLTCGGNHTVVVSR